MTATFYPGNLQWFGIAKETTPGTPMASPSIWIPVDSPKRSPKVTQLVDTALRGTMAMQHQTVPGMAYEEVQYKTYLYPDSLYAHLIAMLGHTDTVSGSSDPYTHKTALYNGSGTDNAQPPSYTLFLYEMNGKVAQIAGARMGDLKYEYKANDWATIDVTWDGMPALFITAPTNTPTALAPEPPTGVTITVGGVNLSDLSDIVVEMKRDTKPIPVLNGTNKPMGIYAGALTVSGSLTAIYQGTADTNLTNLMANNQPAITVATLAAGDTTHPFTLQMSKVAYQTADPQPSNNSWMTIQSNYNAMGNATDAVDGIESPIQAIFLNSTITSF
jgi:hypothetical protein